MIPAPGNTSAWRPDGGLPTVVPLPGEIAAVHHDLGVGTPGETPLPPLHLPPGTPASSPTGGAQIPNSLSRTGIGLDGLGPRRLTRCSGEALSERARASAYLPIGKEGVKLLFRNTSSLAKRA